MNLKIVPIGNSLGVRIPQTILMQLDIKKEVLLEIQNGAIQLCSVRKKIREGWSDAFRQMLAAKDDRILDPAVLSEFDKNEWEW